MAFPQVGDTGVQGIVGWCWPVPGGKYAGIVVAYASIYGTPDPRFYFDDNPLCFQCASDTPLEIGAGVTFDIVQGNYAPYATNVQPA